MNTNIERYQSSQKRILWLTYALYALVILAPLGVIIDLVKAREYKQFSAKTAIPQPELLAVLTNHHLWLARTFLGLVLVSMVAVGTMFYGFGYIVALVGIIWWISRIVRGVMALSHQRPLSVS